MRDGTADPVTQETLFSLGLERLRSLESREYGASFWLKGVARDSLEQWQRVRVCEACLGKQEQSSPSSNRASTSGFTGQLMQQRPESHEGTGLCRKLILPYCFHCLPYAQVALTLLAPG